MYEHEEWTYGLANQKRDINYNKQQMGILELRNKMSDTRQMIPYWRCKKKGIMHLKRYTEINQFEEQR